jgi:tetraacyldisaccharide 4'-kinase
MKRSLRPMSMLRSFMEPRIHRWWYERRRPPALLKPLAALYARYPGRRSGRPSSRPPVPVIVVGNLTAGGSGKTPVVEALVRDLGAQGHAVAVVSRGYGAAPPQAPYRVRSEDAAAIAGDEPLALTRATGVPVWLDPDRRAALRAAVEHGATVVISDDGLQHAGLPRSFEICVIDGRRGFGNGALLPAGPLREPVERIESVDAVLIKAPLRVPLPVDGMEFRLEGTGIRSIDGERRLEAVGQGVDAVAGIADPVAFFEDLEEAGFRPRRHPLADHQAIDPAWLKRLPGPVVMTAKDAARVPAGLREDLFVAGIRAALPETLLERVRAHVREFRP